MRNNESNLQRQNKKLQKSYRKIRKDIQSELDYTDKVEMRAVAFLENSVNMFDAITEEIEKMKYDIEIHKK